MRDERERVVLLHKLPTQTDFYSFQKLIVQAIGLGFYKPLLQKWPKYPFREVYGQN